VCGGDHRIRVIAAGVTPPRILPLPQIPPSSRVAQMAALLSDPSRADVTFVVEGEKIKAHSVLLAARSEYFERMLCGGFAEAGSSAAGSAAQIPIQNTTPAAFRALLRYLYTDELAFSEDDVVHVMHKAHEIDERRVYAHCLRYCQEHLAPPNAIGWLVLADKYHMAELRDVASSYVAHNMRRIRMVARDSMHLLAANPTLMLEVLSQAQS